MKKKKDNNKWNPDKWNPNGKNREYLEFCARNKTEPTNEGYEKWSKIIVEMVRSGIM